MRLAVAAFFIVLAGGFALLRFAPAWFLAAPPEGLYICAQPGPNPTPPSSIHLEPGLVEHRSWIEFPIRTDPLPNLWSLCLDGRGITMEPSSIRGSVVRFSLQTRFIDVLWLSHRLEAYLSPEHWVLNYMTCPRHSDGSTGCF